MSDYDELVRANAAIRKILADGAEERLRRIPGVRHVGVGLRARANKITDELCIRVYVAAKRSEADLAENERIPREIDGIPIDVNTPRRAKFSIDAARYRPLRGGILIGNQIIAANEANTRPTMMAGTFGCTATRNSNGKPVLLSNWHVLSAHGAVHGEPIYNPPAMHVPDEVTMAMLPMKLRDDDDLIAHFTLARITDKVDAGIAELDVSSCCRCCGLDYRDEIVGLSEDGVPPTNHLHGMRAAVPGSRVFKVGVTTGRTEGRVVTDSADDMTGHLEGQDYTLSGQIEIASDDPLDSFSLAGDSGSVVVDEAGYAVGLLFASTDDPTSASFANHMSDVCREMDIRLNLVPPPHGSATILARRNATFPMPLSPTGADLYARARERVEADAAGRWLWSLAEMHREEIVHLVTDNRRVNVIWQRAGGPALFATALNRLRAGDFETLPVPPGGGSLEEAMAQVGGALEKFGSDALRGALMVHGAAIRAAAGQSGTFTDFLDRLRPHALGYAEAMP